MSLAIPEIIGKSSSAPNLMASNPNHSAGDTSDVTEVPDLSETSIPTLDELHRNSCSQAKNRNTSIVTVDINMTNETPRVPSDVNEGVADGAAVPALKNSHSESDDSGFGSERKHSHGSDTYVVGPGNDKMKRTNHTKNAVVSSSDVSLHTNYSLLVDFGDELTPVTEV